MLARLAIATVLVASMASPSSADVEIHVTCAEDVASDPAYETSLKTTLQRALGARTDKVIVDVSIVGDDEPVPMMQREFVQRNIAEPDLSLLSVTDDPAEAVAVIERFTDEMGVAPNF